MFQITNDEILSTHYIRNEKNHNVLSDTITSKVDENIKNLSTIKNFAKFKKSDLTKYKKFDLPKANFVKVNSSKTIFFTFETKKTFMYV